MALNMAINVMSDFGPEIYRLKNRIFVTRYSSVYPTILNDDAISGCVRTLYNNMLEPVVCVVFDNEQDATIFALKYGHKYK